MNLNHMGMMSCGHVECFSCLILSGKEFKDIVWNSLKVEVQREGTDQSQFGGIICCLMSTILPVKKKLRKLSHTAADALK